MKFNRRIKMAASWMLKCTGGVVFFLLIRKVGISAILEASARTQLVPFMSAIFVLIIISLIKGIRWWIICRGYGMEVSLKPTLRIYLIGLFLGLLTPGRLGELTRAYHLSRQNIAFSKGIYSVLLDRVYDFIMLFLLAGISFVYLQMKYGVFIQPKADIRLVAGVVSVVVIAFAAYKAAGDKILGKIKGVFGSLAAYHQSPSNHLRLVGLTLLSVILGYIQLFWVAISLDISMHFLDFCACLVIVGMVQLLPISVLGIGTRDISLVYLFSLFGMDAERAIALSLIILVVNIAVVVPGFILFLLDGSMGERLPRAEEQTPVP